jgi:HD-like signal output (HDOD) protein
MDDQPNENNPSESRHRFDEAVPKEQVGPPPIMTYVELFELASADELDSQRVEAWFASRPGARERLLNIANSTGLGLRNPVKRVSHAIRLLGARGLRKMSQPYAEFAAKNSAAKYRRLDPPSNALPSDVSPVDVPSRSKT